MHRADQQAQRQITDLMEACVGYWELRGIAREHIAQMQLELEQHLQQAVSDGKTLEAVLGPHPAAFAETWAREMRPASGEAVPGSCAGWSTRWVW